MRGFSCNAWVQSARIELRDLRNLKHVDVAGHNVSVRPAGTMFGLGCATSECLSQAAGGVCFMLGRADSAVMAHTSCVSADDWSFQRTFITCD